MSRAKAGNAAEGWRVATALRRRARVGVGVRRARVARGIDAP